MLALHLSIYDRLQMFYVSLYTRHERDSVLEQNICTFAIDYAIYSLLVATKIETSLNEYKIPKLQLYVAPHKNIFWDTVLQLYINTSANSM